MACLHILYSLLHRALEKTIQLKLYYSIRPTLTITFSFFFKQTITFHTY